MEYRHILELIVMTLSMSADAFVLGVSYGIRRVTVPPESGLIIGMLSGLLYGAGLLVGNGVIFLLPGLKPNLVGALLLVALGLYYLADELLKRGQELDLDGSRSLDRREALLLGLVLSADGSVAGVSSAMLQMNGVLTAVLVCLCQIGLLRLGLVLGRRCERIPDRAGLLSGLLFLLSGIWRLL